MLKSLEEVGGQNPIDPARLGCKIYHGKYIYNFKETYEFLKKKNISRSISNIDQLAKHLTIDLNNIRKGQNNYFSIVNKLGNKTLNGAMKNINKFLFNESNKA